MKTNSLLLALTFSLLSVTANASTADSRLLAMVPEDAQIVSGMKLTPATQGWKQLPLVVHNNNVDFEDWLALVGVDPQLSGRQVVEVAASSPRGELAERLLLVEGTFAPARIDRATLEGGASAAEFAGVRVIIVLPFARDTPADVGVRWLAFPDDQTALFGTPLLVQQALTRRAAHAGTNAALLAHLAELRADVDEWNVVTLPPGAFERHLGERSYAAAAIRSLISPDDLVIGFRYARSATTIEFVAHMASVVPEDAVAPNGRAQLLAARFHRDGRVRVERISVEGARVSGTLIINTTSGKDSTREVANR